MAFIQLTPVTICMSTSENHMVDPISMMIYSSLSACISYVNTSRNIKNQNSLATLNKQYQEGLERNRQDFQIEMHYKNVDLQKQIVKLNHECRIDEQQVNFQNLIKQIEWQFFLQNWPLTVAPTVIRDEAYISKIGDSKVVALRIILAKSQDEYFNKFVLPSVEHNLQNFVNKNYPQMGSHPIVYYSSGWKTNSSSGGAAYSNLRYALNGLPTLIITPTVINEKIHIDVAIWGLGSQTSYQDTLFTLPFKRVVIDNNKVDNVYCEALAESIRLHFNYITGWIADSYYLIEYNLMPLLPTIVSQDSCHEKYQELKSFFSSRYVELYETILGHENNNLPIDNSDIRKMKMCLLPEMSLSYAKNFVPLSESEELSKFLTDSIESWLYLRTKEDVSWKSISDIVEYFSTEDLNYIKKIKEILLLINDEENYRLLEDIEIKLTSKMQISEKTANIENKECSTKIKFENDNCEDVFLAISDRLEISPKMSSENSKKSSKHDVFDI